MAAATQKLITAVFFQLLNKKNLDKISVREIVERCRVNRNTFYYHFSDIYDLFDCAFCDACTHLAAMINEKGSVTAVTGEIAAFLTQNRNAMKNAYFSSARSIINDRLNTFLESLLTAMAKRIMELNSLTQGPDARLIHFYRCALIGTLDDWFTGDGSYPADKLLSEAIRYVEAGLHANIVNEKHKK